MLFTATNFRMLSLALAGVLAIASFTSAELIRTVQRGNLPIEPTHFTVSHDAPRSWRRDGDSFANATLSRRAGGKVRNVHLSDGFHSDLAIDGKPPPFRAAKPGGGTPEVVLERLIASGMGVPGCGVGTGEGLTEGAMDADSSLSLM